MLAVEEVEELLVVVVLEVVGALVAGALVVNLMFPALVGRLTVAVVVAAVVMASQPAVEPVEVVAVPASSSSVMQIHLEKRHPQQVPQQLPLLAVTASTHLPDLGALLSNGTLRKTRPKLNCCASDCCA
jgi:hypothetical protein